MAVDDEYSPLVNASVPSPMATDALRGLAGTAGQMRAQSRLGMPESYGIGRPRKRQGPDIPGFAEPPEAPQARPPEDTLADRIKEQARKQGGAFKVEPGAFAPQKGAFAIPAGAFAPGPFSRAGGAFLPSGSVQQREAMALDEARGLGML